jgi:hypothetical protein
MKSRIRFRQFICRFAPIGAPLSVLLIALALPQTSDAQVLYGSITGNVIDSSGAVVAVPTHREVQPSIPR